MVRAAAIVGALFCVLAPLAACAATPRSGPWLFQQVADQAAREAQAAAAAGDASAAQTWRAWEALYRKDALLPQVQQMSALQLTQVLAKSNEDALPAARAEGSAVKINLLVQSIRLWDDLGSQLQRGGGDLQVRFDRQAMLTPVQGVEGTPWSAPTVTATAADCASIDDRIRLCEAQVSQAEHESAMGMGDQGDYILVRQAQCHRWEEMKVAYCSGR